MCSLKPEKVTDNSKGTSLLHYGINYGRKKFYDTGSGVVYQGQTLASRTKPWPNFQL